MPPNHENSEKPGSLVVLAATQQVHSFHFLLLFNACFAGCGDLCIACTFVYTVLVYKVYTPRWASAVCVCCIQRGVCFLSRSAFRLHLEVRPVFVSTRVEAEAVFLSHIVICRVFYSAMPLSLFVFGLSFVTKRESTWVCRFWTYNERRLEQVYNFWWRADFLTWEIKLTLCSPLYFGIYGLHTCLVVYWLANWLCRQQ